MAEVNLADIFRKSFGYEQPASFTIPKAPNRREQSSLGQQYYSSENDDLYGREFFLPVYLDEYLLPFAVMGMTWKKTFVTTAMPERGGSVHELISVDDYVFNIKGILVNEDGNFPEQQIISIHEIFKINTSVRLRSALSAIVLNAKDTFNEQVIVKDIKWPPTPGVENARAFEIELESDMAFDLILT